MKLVKEFLYEKFGEHSDPIDDIIGIPYFQRTFKDSLEDFMFLLKDRQNAYVNEIFYNNGTFTFVLSKTYNIETLYQRFIYAAIKGYLEKTHLDKYFEYPPKSAENSRGLLQVSFMIKPQTEKYFDTIMGAMMRIDVVPGKKDKVTITYK